MGLIDPPLEAGGSGSGGWGGLSQGTFGGTSAISVINATTFDIISPDPLFIVALGTGGSYHGTYYATNAPLAYANGSYHWAFGAFGGDEGYPQCVGYHQQRRVFASTKGRPQTVWMSRIGNFVDFGVSGLVLDDDAVRFTLNSGQLNAIRGMLSLRKLLLLTSDNEWVVGSGDSTKSITPSSIQADIQGYRGSSKLVPIGVGNVALYLQSKGKVVRDIGYDFASDSYTGNDLTVMASHLMEGHSVVDWAFAPSPSNVLWMVRDDGMLLGASYMKEQQVIGWHRHDTDGKYESVCVIPENGEDVLYVTVARTINGVEQRYVERMESRDIESAFDWFFVDCGLTFDGRTGFRGTATDHTATTLTLSGGTAWDDTETITCTASVALFNHPVGTDAGDAIVFEDANGQLYKFTILDTSSTTVATGMLNRVLPAAYRGVARTDWYFARNTISGLGYLEGKTVSILADGAEMAPQTVTDGAITLERPSFIVHVGLPITADIQTLELMDTQQGVTLGKKKSISGMSLMVDKSASIYAGRDFDHLEEQKNVDPTDYDAPTQIHTGMVKTSFSTSWGRDGSFVIRHTHPTPVSILALVPELVAESR
jgi:hypothetical protein